LGRRGERGGREEVRFAQDVGKEKGAGDKQQSYVEGDRRDEVGREGSGAKVEGDERGDERGEREGDGGEEKEFGRP
jgi:hypothetical protein